MKNLKKIFSLLIIFSLTVVLGIQGVFAADVPSTIKVSSIGKINYGGTYNFPVKYTSDGTLAYCTEYSDLYPMGITMSNPKRLEPGVSYIIANGYKGTKADYGNDTKMKQYYITQLAIYTYLGQANPKNNNDVHKAVWDLVNKAKDAKQNDVTLEVSLTAASEKMKLTSDGKYFISEAITVKSNVASQSFSIAASQNVGAFVVDANGKTVTSVKSGDKVYAKVPSSVITDGQTVTLSVTVKGSRTKQAAYLYQPSESKYQNITPGITYPKTETATATVKVKATKDKKTKVKISKRDITTKEELPGAKLVIKDASGNVKASWTSTNEPKYIEGLAAGNYTLCETQAPDGYVLETECINFTIKSDGTVASVVMYNKKKPTTTKVKISKKDITTKEELPGAKLVIKDANGNVKASWTSTSTPKYIEGLAAGNYTLCETQAPDGYKLETECIKFTVKADGTVASVVMYNEKKPTTTKVKISKRDITTKEELPGAKLVIKDANGNVKASWTSTNEPKYIEGLAAGNYTLCETQAPDGYKLETECINFTVKANGTVASVIMYNEKKPTTTKVKISKQDITDKKELPGAKLVIKDANGNVKASWTSTNEPKYIEGLAAGTYYLSETAAPSGYELYTESIKFTVYANGTVSKVIMYNSPKKVTKVKISKQDITTKKELPGASLTIKDANGKEVISWVSTNEPKYIENLAAGNYTLCETAAPQGYELYTECIKFTVKADGSLATVIMYNTPKKEEEPKTKLSIIKKDADTKEALAGATFELKDKNGKLVETWVSTKEAKVFNNLSEGTYTLTETKAPKGYVLNTKPMTFELKANNKTTTVIMYNKKEEEKPTKVKISKQDITTKKELPGATLVIKDANGKEIENWVSTNEPKYIENLAVGNYTLCETQAPDGYVLATECIKFTVKDDGSIASVIMYNSKKPIEEEPKPTKVQISKQDITTKEELPGATLVIKDANGKEIEKWVSTNEPKYIENLAEGKYTLCETQAPAGYVLATECVNFTVKADGNVTKVVMYNTKKEDPKVYKTKISKQDITTKEELPGATLVIKNAEGVELHKFVSSNTPTYFELQPGTYTLTEIQAPDGYILSTEVITFTVSEDHTVVTEVVMYNTPAVDVPITASNVSMIVYVIGLLGIAFGFKTVFVNARI